MSMIDFFAHCQVKLYAHTVQGTSLAGQVGLEARTWEALSDA